MPSTKGLQKDWYKSKTVWVAILQFAAGVIGVVVGILQNQSGLDVAGVVIAGKALVDLYLRFQTETGLKSPLS